MIDCLIIGDSIAVGIGMHQKQCVTQAVSGYTSARWNNQFKANPKATNVIISLGTNDLGINTYIELRQLRERISARDVKWIVPPIADAQAAVLAVANEYKDVLVYIKELSGDKIHPTQKEYKQLGEQIK